MADYKSVLITSDNDAPVRLQETPKGYELTVGCKGIPELGYVDCLHIYRAMRMMFPCLATVDKYE